MEHLEEPSPDTKVSHYRRLNRLGEGGMGEVYVGIDETLKRRVALKAVHSRQRLHAESKTRFLREAQILSQLDHPNICRVYDYIEDDHRDWLVLELIEGKNLRCLLQSGLDWSAKLRVAEQIADVLVVTHAAGIVHRDLKPGNVMVTENGAVKVLDFGLAKLTDREEAPDTDVTRTEGAVTADGTVVGSAAYMSPEQAEGKKVDARSDIFSFGSVLYEILTGRRAFQGDSR